MRITAIEIHLDYSPSEYITTMGVWIMLHREPGKDHFEVQDWEHRTEHFKAYFARELTNIEKLVGAKVECIP